MNGDHMRQLIYKIVPYDKPVKRRLDKLSFRAEEQKLHPGQIVGMLWDYDAENGSDGLVCMINEEHYFLTGLLPMILRWCEQKKIKVEIVDLRADGGDLNFEPTALLKDEKKVELRDYQQEVVETALTGDLRGLKWYRGVLKVATGGGKTEIAVGMYQCNHLPTVFLVHRKDLMEQAAQRFEKYGIDCGRIGDNEFQLAHSTVTVATIQTIWSIMKNPEDVRNGPLQTLFEGTKQLFMDESHLMAGDLDKANTFMKISRQFENADVRWGLTATPFIKEDDFSNSLLRGATGDLLCDISNKALIDREFLTPPKVKMIVVEHTQSYWDEKEGFERRQPTGRGTKWHEIYEYVVTASPARNKAIVKAVEDAPKPCLVLLQQKKHLEYLRHFGLPDYPVLTGSDSKKKRMATVKAMREGAVDVIVCTTIFDEGVDIPELRAVIMAGGGKSKIKTLQRLGRGLRLAEGKDEVQIVDFIDFNPVTPGWLANKHSKERMKVYREEGFDVEMEEA
jgi:superfamily II DNA or RNA helicase